LKFHEGVGERLRIVPGMVSTGKAMRPFPRVRQLNHRLLQPSCVSVGAVQEQGEVDPLNDVAALLSQMDGGHHGVSFDLFPAAIEET